MAAPLGLWLAVFGYVIAYGGMLRIGGHPASIGDIVGGRAKLSATSPSTSSGQTQAQGQAQLQGQQQAQLSGSMGNLV
jgi:hypothetical protein